MALHIPKKILVLIPATMVAAIGLVSMLAWVALRPIYKKNGFNRNIIEPELQVLHVLDKDDQVIGTAGNTDSHLFFKTTDPGTIYMTNYKLENGKYFHLKVPKNKRLASTFYCEVDSPIVHIMAPNGPAVLTATLDGTFSEIHRFPTTIFSRAVRISQSTYVFRGFDTTLRRAGQIFIKGNPQTGELFRLYDSSKRKSGDVGLITDGYMNYDDSTNLITYTSFYTNRFFALDTNLNLVYTSHTIDTTNSVQIETTATNGVVTNASAVRTINTRIRAGNGRLYTVSKLKADNENDDRFRNSTVLDCYDISTGKYERSIYLPYYHREKISDYKITRHNIIVVYHNYIVVYAKPLNFN